MTPTQDMIERVAKAIYETYHAQNAGYFQGATNEDGSPLSIVPWSKMLPEDKAEWLSSARAAIEAMGEVHSQATGAVLTTPVPEAPERASLAERIIACFEYHSGDINRCNACGYEEDEPIGKTFDIYLLTEQDRAAFKANPKAYCDDGHVPHYPTERVAKLEEALVWCSAASDFQEGGIARVGWLKLCRPLLQTLSPPTGASGKTEGESESKSIANSISKLSSQHMTAGGREP